jgi:hypothetical protein
MYKTIAREKNTTIVQQQPILNKRLQLPKVHCNKLKRRKPSEHRKRKLEVVKIKNEEFYQNWQSYFNEKGSVDINGTLLLWLY